MSYDPVRFDFRQTVDGHEAGLQRFTELFELCGLFNSMPWNGFTERSITVQNVLFDGEREIIVRFQSANYQLVLNVVDGIAVVSDPKLHMLTDFNEWDFGKLVLPTFPPCWDGFLGRERDG